jgi:hypothetical protein
MEAMPESRFDDVLRDNPCMQLMVDPYKFFEKRGISRSEVERIRRNI